VQGRGRHLSIALGSERTRQCDRSFCSGLAAGFFGVPGADAATLVKKQKADPQPVGKTCPDTWYYYKGKCIPYGRSWYGAPRCLYHYAPGAGFSGLMPAAIIRSGGCAMARR